MKVVLIIVITLLVLGAVGGGIYAYTRPKTDTAMINPTSDTLIPSAQPTSAKMTAGSSSEFSGKLTDLFARADSQACTLKDTTSGMSGVFYISNGRVRAQAKVAQSNMPIDIIIKDNNMYFWTTTPMPYGFKTTLNELENMATTPAAGSGATNEYQDVLTKQQTFDCLAWNVDESKFILPSDITFNSIAH